MTMSSSHEPELQTDPRLQGVLQDLMDLEPVFHHPEPGATRRKWEMMMDKEFWETGASGRRYGKAYVLDVLEDRKEHQVSGPLEATDAWCRDVGPDTYLLTYTLRQGNRVTRRASLWRNTSGRWTILYHQGTVVEGTG